MKKPYNIKCGVMNIGHVGYFPENYTLKHNMYVANSSKDHHKIDVNYT